MRSLAGHAPTDLRKSFDSLAELVRQQLQGEPLSGQLFVFRNKRGDRVKLLYWDEDGFVIIYKRLEAGTFHFPKAEAAGVEVAPPTCKCCSTASIWPVSSVGGVIAGRYRHEPAEACPSRPSRTPPGVRFCCAGRGGALGGALGGAWRCAGRGGRRAVAARLGRVQVGNEIFFVNIYICVESLSWWPRLIGMSTVAPTSKPVSTDPSSNLPLPTPEQLPDDPETLKRMILELLATLRVERRDKEGLRHRLELLLRRLYGPRSERFNPDQLLLFGAEAADADNTTAAPASTSAAPTAGPQAAPRRRRCKPHGRGRLPANLPRRPLHHELSEAERICPCGHARVDIGVDISERLDWQPASLFVWQDVTHKYVCPHCRQQATGAALAPTAPEANTTATEATMATTTPEANMNATEPAPATTAPEANTNATEATASPSVQQPGAATGPIGPVVVSAAKPPMPIAKGLPGPGLLAHVIVSKYCDHLPLHRQAGILGRQGVSISRSTLCDWMAAAAQLLRPLYNLMVTLVLRSLWMHTDDTTVKNQGHAPGTTATARFWIYLGDRTHPYNVFDFTVNRKRDGPQKFLADFQGYLHADAFSGYDALYLPSPRDGIAPDHRGGLQCPRTPQVSRGTRQRCPARPSGLGLLRATLRPRACRQGQPTRR